jgi:RNA recognition motif-containing protein
MASDPPNSESNFANLYVKCFPQTYGEEELHDLFGGYGPIQSIKVMSDPRGRKFAFVNFERHDDARSCRDEMHLRDLRPRAERKASREAPPVAADADGHPEHLLFVGRAQSKAERQARFNKEFKSDFGDRSAAPARGLASDTHSALANGRDGGKGAQVANGHAYACNSHHGLGMDGAMSATTISARQGFGAHQTSRGSSCGSQYNSQQLSCGFQQQHQVAQYDQQASPYYYNTGYGANGYGEGVPYDGSSFCDGNYGMNGGYGAYFENGTSHYGGNNAWGTYGSYGNFSETRDDARKCY